MVFFGSYSCEPTPLKLSDDAQFYIIESLCAMKGIIMRTIILAVLLGLFSIPAAFAAPSSNCSVTVKNGNPVLKGCSAKQRKQFLKAFDWASSKPTTKAVDKLLRKRQGKFYLSIRNICYGYETATRRPVSSKAIERCASRLDYSPKSVVLKAENNVKAIKKCIGIKSYQRQLDCMIESKNSQELEDIILAALDIRDAYIKGLKDLKKFGCKLKRGKLQCASSTGLLLAALFMFLLGRWRPELRVVIGVLGFIIGVASCITDANAEPCVNQAYHLSSPNEVLTCDLVFSSTESNRKYTLNALDQAYLKVCSQAEDYIACDALYQEARKLFKERMGAIILREATVLADAHYGDGRVSACPLSQNICNSINWKVK